MRTDDPAIPELIERLHSAQVMLQDLNDTLRLCVAALRLQPHSARTMSQTDRHALVLQLSSETKLTQSQIAERVGIHERTVRKIISAAKAAKTFVPARIPQRASHSLSKDASDPGAGTEGEKPSEDITGSEEERTGGIEPVQAQGGEEPVVASPVLAAAGGEEEQSKSPPVCETQQDPYERVFGISAPKPKKHHSKDIEVDLPALKVNGPLGVLQLQKAETPVARVLRHMQDCKIYDLKTLTTVGGYATTGLTATMLQVMRERLKAVGVTVYFASKELVKLSRVEG